MGTGTDRRTLDFISWIDARRSERKKQELEDVKADGEQDNKEIKKSTKQGWHRPDPVIDVERNATSQRTEHAFFMTQSRRWIEKRLTKSMSDAEREIENAFRNISGSMGYKSGADINKARGGRPPEPVQMHYDRMNSWSDFCSSEVRALVIDHLVYGMTFPNIAEEQDLDRKTVSKRYFIGLDLYCQSRGWGKQRK